MFNVTMPVAAVNNVVRQIVQGNLRRTGSGGKEDYLLVTLVMGLIAATLTGAVVVPNAVP